MAAPSKLIFAYMGNKGDIADFIVNSFEPHKKYVEVFGGTGQVLLHKPKADGEIYNDVNPHLTNMFEIIRTRAYEFMKQLDELIISERLYNDFFEKLDSSPDDMERAIRYFYIMTFAHMGKFTGGFSVPAATNFNLEAKKATIRFIQNRFRNVVVTNKSYEKIITANNNASTTLYLDPPYVSTEMYYEKLAGSFTIADHHILRDLLKQHKGQFVLSYEADPLVSDLYSDYYILGKNKFRPGRGEFVEEIIVTNREPNTMFGTRNTIEQFKDTLF